MQHHDGTQRHLESGTERTTSSIGNISSGQSLNARNVKPYTKVTNAESLFSSNVETKASRSIQPGVNPGRYILSQLASHLILL